MMKFVELGICCEIINGSTPSRIIPEYWGGDINWFTPKDLSNLQGKFINESPEKINPKGYSSCSTSMLPANSLLYTSRAPIGHIAINKIECCTNQGFKSLIPKKGVDVNYLYYTLKQFTPQLQNLGNGATFKELSKATMSEFQIPLPPLETQQKIASILDAADTLRQKDKALLAKYDELPQSLFLDMFGDPASNPKGWEESTLGEVLDIITYGLTVRPSYHNEGISLISAREIRSGVVNLASAPKISKEDFENLSAKGKPVKGDILFSKTGSIGHCAIVEEKIPFAVTQNAARLTFREDINKMFALNFMRTPYIQRESQSWAKGNAVKDLQLGDMKKFKFLLPPLELQNQFEERIISIINQKLKAQASSEKSEELFNSLLQKAFKGELV